MQSQQSDLDRSVLRAHAYLAPRGASGAIAEGNFECLTEYSCTIAGGSNGAVCASPGSITLALDAVFAGARIKPISERI